MSLDHYRAKRDFRRTPEPKGRTRAKRAAALSFVVQKHAASHLHYDFRLEHDGVLWSWAIPKGPSVDPQDKRLAVQVEDHPLEYGGFEGIIPAGAYGAGTVMVWDRGTWTPQGDAAAGYAKGHLKFTLDGDKLHGGYALVRTRGGKYGGKSAKPTWLLIKENDVHAQRRVAIVDAAPDSVQSGRTLEGIAQSRAPAKNSKRVSAKAPSVPAVRLPATMSPMLATLVEQAPAGEDWIHEIKYDGYRMLARVDGGRAHLYSRNGRDWTRYFPGLAADLAALPGERMWLDGEVVIVDAHGRTNFQALQNALSDGTAEGLAFFAFDLLHRDGRDLRDLPLEERKRELREVMGDGRGNVRVGPEVRGGGPDFHRQACALGLEGIIAKRAGSTYAAGKRSREWLKVKCLRRQEMVIGGYTQPQGSRTGFGALLLGVYDHGALRYAGKVGTGFDERTLRDLTRQLARREQAEAPFVDPPRGFAAKGVRWVRPDLVAEVSFSEWSADGALRHPSFAGLRVDKKATEVKRENSAADAVPRKRARAGAAKSAARSDADAVGGVVLSHPDKVYFPEAGITKRELAQFYVDVADRLLPHIAARPLSLVRCPDGWRGQCFYQKHAADSVHEAVTRVQVADEESDEAATYFAANSAAALAGLVQWGVIELHPWGARAPRLDRPDRLVFDFDPDPKLEWPDVVAAVKLLRTLLDELGLAGFLKTTGGKGLHVVVPIRPTITWDQAKSFTRGVARFLATTFPDRFTDTLAKNRRGGKIFIDYLRNARGATAVAPYTVRARENAPVAMPIAWSELATDVRFDHFNLRNVRDRLRRQRRDPWADFFATRQALTADIRGRFV